MKFKKDEDGKLVLDDAGDPIAISDSGEVIPLDKVVSLGKHQRIESERDEYKARVDSLTADIEKLKGSAGDADALRKQIEELSEAAKSAESEFTAKLAERDRDHAIETALMGAGCVDTKAARAHIGTDGVTFTDGKLTGLDLETFKTDRPYLFKADTTVSTSAPSSGDAGEDDSSLRSAMGLKAKE